MNNTENYRKRPSEFLWNNRLLWTVILFVIAALLSMAKPVVLSDGGAVTYFSLFFLWLITFFFGPKYGLAISIIFGFAKFFVTYITGEYINYAPGALILEYPVACGVFALGGLLKIKDKAELRIASLNYTGFQKGHITTENVKLRLGYLIGVAGMGVCYIISAVLFYPPDREGFIPNLLYCIKYDMSYLLIEAAMTLLILCIPRVTDAVFFLKHVAVTKPEDPTLKYF